MDKVGSEGEEARAMMREIRTLSLNPGANLGGVGALFSNDPNHSSEYLFSPKINSNFDFQSRSESLLNNSNTNLNNLNHRNNYNDNSNNSINNSNNIFNDLKLSEEHSLRLCLFCTLKFCNKFDSK